MTPCARVHRDHPQPQLTAGHPAARGLPRERQGRQAHAGQPVALGCATRRELSHPAQRRRGGGVGVVGAEHRARTAARTCRCGARCGARLGVCAMVRLGPAGAAAAAAGHAGGARAGAGLQAGHAPLAARRHGQLLAGARAGRGPVRRGRPVPLRWTGCTRRSRPSSGAWRASIWWAPRWCCTT